MQKTTAVDQNTIGLALAERRNELGLTQQYVAELTGMSTRALIAWETGKGNPGLRQLSLVLRVLGLEMMLTKRPVQ